MKTLSSRCAVTVPRGRGVLLGIVLALNVPAAYAEEAPLVWQYRTVKHAVTLTANPLGNASREAFYTARGFTAEAIRPYAQACGFSFGMQNGSQQTLTTRLTDWQAVDAHGRKIPLRPLEDWDAEWQKAGVSQPARIAFRWAQFQTENTFEPGDWIMGMATLEMRPNTPVRLIARYRDAQGNHEITLKRIACAND